ncbi:MAG: tyrosine-type recombinase/integrase [Pseudomonadota bacterium]|nr:tyrosine-type recombinase/integrase [Pseudomonadota bacterium]
MLTTYFKHPFTLRKLRSGPAGPYLDDFASQLTQAGYCRNKIRAHLRGAGRFSAWAARAGLTIDTLDSPALAQFGRCLDSQGCLRCCRGEYSNTFVGARHFVGFLQARGVVPTPAPAVEPELLTEFCHWMHTQRGVTERTLNDYRPALRRLLDTLGEHPEHYTAKQLRGFVLDRTRGHRTSQARTTVTVLRMFLRCLITQGRCAPELLLAIPTIAGWRRSSLPSYLCAEEIERMIDTCDGTTAIGARDRAVLLLLARLGLRAGDVAALQLNDIDWEQGLFRVAGKNRRQTSLPLPQDVGEALLHYLTNHRPCVDTSRVFITAIAPFVPFSRWIVSTITARALYLAHIDAPSYGAHLLRHSAATAMLRQGTSMEAIGAVLRHTSIETTHVYTKVDVDLLDQVVMPWLEVESC